MADTGGMRDLILSTLTAIVQDKSASASVRVQATRALAEVLGMLKQTPKPSSVSAIEELSEGELDALIASRQAGASSVTDTVAPPPSLAVSEPKHVAGQRVKRPKRARAPRARAPA